jgi:pimeloyl-ACP methyl ester carboxylesterase
LKDKDLFKNFTDQCLEDYIEYGMNKNEDGYSLRFDRNIEYKIFRTIPHILYKYEGRLSVPTALIYGDKSNVIDRMDLYNMKKKYNIKDYKIHGSHMFPMEAPELTADLIFKAVDEVIS